MLKDMNRFLPLIAAIASLAAQTDTEARLKAIYEQGAFRPAPVAAEWLPDSSGYRLGDVIVDARTAQNRTLSAASEARLKHGRLLSPDGKLLLKYEDQNIFVLGPNNERTQLTQRPAGKSVRYFNASWSPDSKRIVFVESDVTNVRQRSVLVPEDPSYPGVRHDVFARVGEEIAKLRVGVADVSGQNVQWLKIESPKEGIYLGQVEWAGNSEEVLVEKFSRFRNEREFLLAKTTGEVKRIYHETNDAWVESSQGKISGLVWMQGGKAFVVVSEKDGWRHAFVYSRDGHELYTLTPGHYDVIDRGAVDEAGGSYYFYASPRNGTQTYLHKVPLDGSAKMERITPADQPGTHNYNFSPDTKWAIHEFSALNSPPRVELVELPSHRVVRVLETNDKLRRQVINPAEFLQLDIGKGIVMDAWLLKPRNFDASKKYPVFVYVYGEPHAQTVLDQWGAAHIDFHRVVADLGYIVVSIDNRGTPAPKGAAWRRSIFGSLGPLSTDEQEAGLKELARMRPYVDLNRVGIWGWSGGGSNTLNALFRKPDTYHVGIAVVPKPQPHLYNAWFQEMFMHTREVNPEGYKKSAPLHFAEGLKGKLLIMTGSGETNTHIQIIEGLIDRLVELGKPFDYMVYPNRDHGLREGAGTTVHVRMKIIRYLLENLPAGPK
ncbi:MAG: S9 family peptidase [Acidobacteria bacterium]|nr:S9 family peptidase [Acidobacteriota bacterium]